jgi:hypothetical protein
LVDKKSVDKLLVDEPGFDKELVDEKSVDEPPSYQRFNIANKDKRFSLVSSPISMETTRMYCKQVLIALTQGLDINKKKEKNVAKRSIYLRTTEKSEQNQTLISRTLSCVNKDMEIASLPLNGNLSRVVQKTKKNFAKIGPNVEPC